MASLAVFRELYNSQKDIYDVISKFIIQLILDKSFRTFELQEIKVQLNKVYGFELPSAVIKSTLNRLSFLEKKCNLYTVTDALSRDISSEFHCLSENVKRQNERIIEALISYVEQRINRLLNDDEQEKLKIAFCSYVIDDMTNVDYSELISAFLVSHKNEEDFVKQLNKIKQGLIIYVGLCYNTNAASVDAIDIPLHIYMEMEVLFSMAGYNGILFKTLFDEFYQQVEEINKKARKQIIHFHYFTETDKEISSYFNAAELIVRGKMILDPSKQAMMTIVRGCKDAYMIKEKYSEFKNLLKRKDITLDEQERYYDKEQQIFNIEHEAILDKLAKEATVDDIENKLRLLNYISIKRGSKSQTIFRNIGHILLSGNSLTFKIAFDSDIRKEKEIPLATSIDFLTNRFWLSLNKGLKTDMSLRSFDIITKAQIVMSSSVNDTIGRLFKEFEEEDKQGTFDKEKKKRILADLHSKVITPENVTIGNEETYLNTISINDIEQLNASLTLEQEKVRGEREQHEKEMTAAKKEREKNQKTLEIAAKEILTNRNREIRVNYKNEMENYKKQRRSFYLKEYRKNWYKSLLYAIGYSSIIISFAIFSITRQDWNIVLSSLFSIIVAALPFLRPLIDHTPIKKSFAFCFQRKKRKRIKQNFLERYEENNPKPNMKIYTKEEVLKELREIANL